MLIDSLSQAFTSSKKTPPAIAGKIAELPVDSMLVGGEGEREETCRSTGSKNELKNIHRQKTANRELGTRVFETRKAAGRYHFNLPTRTVLSPRFLYYLSLMEKRFLAM